MYRQRYTSLTLEGDGQQTLEGLAHSKHSLSRKNLLGKLKKTQDGKTLTPFSERLKLCTALCGLTLGMNMSSPS